MSTSIGAHPRLVKVRAGLRGSGWCVGDRGVLTAFHVVGPHVRGTAEQCLAILDPRPGGVTFGCDVVWHDPDRDLALLRVHDIHADEWAAAVGVSASPALTAPGHSVIEVQATGYPDATVDERLPVPDSVRGLLAPAAAAVHGRMTLDVDGSVPDGAQMWQGMSGAGVMTGDRLVGVVVRVDKGRGYRRLHVAVLPDPAATDDFADALRDVGARAELEDFGTPRLRALLRIGERCRPSSVAEAQLDTFGTRLAREDIDTRGDAFYPYARRALDDRLTAMLDAHLGSSGRMMILLAGRAMTGKSRMGAEALKAHPVLRDWLLFVPRQHANLREVGLLPHPFGAVVWLDDLENYVVGMDIDLLDSWRRDPKLIVVGTLRSDLLQNMSEVRSSWDLITDGRLVAKLELGEWSEADQAALADADAIIQDSVRDGVPLGEVLGAGTELLKRFENAEDPNRALVGLVADWARTGVAQPLSESLARELWPQYLPARLAREIDDMVETDARHEFGLALDWVKRKVLGTGTRLVRQTVHGLRAEDYIVSRRAQLTIPDRVWMRALDVAGQEADSVPDALLDVGYQAMMADRRDLAVHAFERVAAGSTAHALLAQVALAEALADSDRSRAIEMLEGLLSTDDPQIVPLAKADLAGLLANENPARSIELAEAAMMAESPVVVALAKASLSVAVMNTDPDRAKELLEQIIASGPEFVVPLAQANLSGVIMHTDPLRARQLAEAAFVSGSGQVRTIAQANLGALLAEDPARSRELLMAAMQSGDPHAVAHAQVNLAVSLFVEDPDRAQSLLESALNSRNPAVLPLAEANLGALLTRIDPARARELLESAGRSANDTARSLASVALGVMLAPTEPERARELLRSAASSPQLAARAYRAVGDLELASGDELAARSSYQAAIDIGDRYWSSVARMDLSRLLQSEDPAVSAGLLEEVILSGPPQLAEAAQIDLGALLMTAAPERAQVLLEGAMASKDPVLSALAQVNLAATILADEPVRGRALLESALGTGLPAVVPVAQANLAALLLVEDPVTARGMLESALASGNRWAMPLATANLAGLLMAEDPVRARAMLESGVTSSNPRVRFLAQSNLAAMIMADDPVRARALVESVLDSGDPQVRPMAQTNLGILLSGEDPDRARQLLEEAVKSANPQVLPVAQSYLGGLLTRTDRRRGKEMLAASFAHPIRSNPDAQERAADLLGDFEAEDGDAESAQAAYLWAIGSGRTLWSLHAGCDLAGLIAADDPKRALDLARQAADRAVALDVSELEARARCLIGDLLSHADSDAAILEYRSAIALDDGYWSAVARCRLAGLLADTDPDRARTLLEEVLGSGPEHLVRAAEVDLGGLLVDVDPARARDLLGRAAHADEPDPELKAQAFDRLGDLNVTIGEPAAAAACYRAAIEVGDPLWSWIAMVDLADLIEDDDAASARELLLAATDAPVEFVAEIARQRLNGVG